MENKNQIVEFIKDLYSSHNSFLPLHVPRFQGNEKKYLMDTIESTFVSSVGEYVDLFEQKIAEKTGAKYAIAVVNGTAALHIALKLVGVEPNTEVFTQPLTFVATANAISYEGAIPHFIDVSERSLGMSPDALQKRLEDIGEIKNGRCYNKITGNRIAACVPMHTFGLPLEIDSIIKICDAYGIAVIEDSAESLGSYFKNSHTGTFGELGVFSFNGNKTITCGGGGAIITDDEHMAKRAKHITTTAKIPHKWEYVHDEVAYNYRMPNLNAALACAQLEQLEDFINNKRNTAKIYHDFFQKFNNVSSIIEMENTKSNYWLNAIKFNSEYDKIDFLNYSNENGVMTRPIWKLMNNLKMFRNCPAGDLSVASIMENTIVNIPSSVRL